jgi:hypothetical protein
MVLVDLPAILQESKSLTLQWNPQNPLCGNYSVVFDPSFGHLLTKNGQTVVAKAPET